MFIASQSKRHHHARGADKGEREEHRNDCSGSMKLIQSLSCTTMCRVGVVGCGSVVVVYYRCGCSSLVREKEECEGRIDEMAAVWDICVREQRPERSKNTYC